MPLLAHTVLVWLVARVNGSFLIVYRILRRGGRWVDPQQGPVGSAVQARTNQGGGPVEPTVLFFISYKYAGEVVECQLGYYFRSRAR